MTVGGELFSLFQALSFNAMKVGSVFSVKQLLVRWAAPDRVKPLATNTVSA